MKKLTAKKKAVVQAMLLIIGTMCIAYGAVRGEAGVVLSKAVRICLECVGIG